MSSDQLSQVVVKFHSDDKVDLAFFKIESLGKIQKIDRADTAKELDSVIALGYPNIPTFLSIQTVEQAQVAARLTVTQGEIAGSGTQYLANIKMFLITAKIICVRVLPHQWLRVSRSCPDKTN